MTLAVEADAARRAAGARTAGAGGGAGRPGCRGRARGLTDADPTRATRTAGGCGTAGRAARSATGGTSARRAPSARSSAYGPAPARSPAGSAAGRTGSAGRTAIAGASGRGPSAPAAGRCAAPSVSAGIASAVSARVAPAGAVSFSVSARVASAGTVPIAFSVALIGVRLRLSRTPRYREGSWRGRHRQRRDQRNTKSREFSGHATPPSCVRPTASGSNASQRRCFRQIRNNLWKSSNHHVIAGWSGQGFPHRMDGTRPPRFTGRPSMRGLRGHAAAHVRCGRRGG